MSALLARELAPPYLAAIARHHGRAHTARPRPQPTPGATALAWLRARGAPDALSALTAHPTAVTAEVHFCRTDAYWLVLCHRGRLVRAVETPFRVEGVVLMQHADRGAVAGPPRPGGRALGVPRRRRMSLRGAVWSAQLGPPARLAAPRALCALHRPLYLPAGR